MKNKLRFAVIYGIVLVMASFIPFVGDHIVKLQKYTVEETSSVMEWKGYLNDGRSGNGSIRVKGELFISEKGTVLGGILKMPLATLIGTNLPAEDVKTQLISHFQSSDYSKMEKYPEADFKIKTIRPNQITPGAYQASGDLTILGKTNPITFPVVITFLSNQVEVTGKVSIDRAKWGIGFRNDSVIPNVKPIANLQFKLVAVKGSSNYQLM